MIIIVIWHRISYCHTAVKKKEGRFFHKWTIIGVNLCSAVNLKSTQVPKKQSTEWRERRSSVNAMPLHLLSSNLPALVSFLETPIYIENTGDGTRTVCGRYCKATPFFYQASWYGIQKNKGTCALHKRQDKAAKRGRMVVTNTNKQVRRELYVTVCCHVAHCHGCRHSWWQSTYAW